jgi:hypothetical protein
VIPQSSNTALLESLALQEMAIFDSNTLFTPPRRKDITIHEAFQLILPHYSPQPPPESTATIHSTFERSLECTAARGFLKILQLAVSLGTIGTNLSALLLSVTTRHGHAHIVEYLPAGAAELPSAQNFDGEELHAGRTP